MQKLRLWGIRAYADSVCTVVFQPISHDGRRTINLISCLFQKGRVHRNLTESDQRARSWGQEAHNGHEGEGGADQGTGTEGSGEEQRGDVPPWGTFRAMVCSSVEQQLHTKPLRFLIQREGDLILSPVWWSQALTQAASGDVEVVSGVSRQGEDKQSEGLESWTDKWEERKVEFSNIGRGMQK